MEKKDILSWPDSEMPKEMIDETKEKKKGWTPWKAIRSTVEEAELVFLENQIGLTLPNSYREFLKYKHFYAVHSTDGFVAFRHIIHNWKELLVEKWLDPELKEYFLNKGFILFGDYHDWGFLCFNANKALPENEYPVVLIDHEKIDQHQLIYTNFLECLQENTVRK